MPPSQLKRLKASLRESGITGPQKSKKQRKQNHGSNTADQRLKHQEKLQALRDSFNPFEVQAPARNAKFASATDRSSKVAAVRPGVTKSMGEKNRRQNLLPELQNRNKTGGIMDRRIGEDDATMAPEEKALQRFIREKQKRKSGNVFDLEADDEEGQTGLTHLGKALDLEGNNHDDFDDASLAGSDDASDGGEALLKRRRPSEGDDETADGGEEPLRKKTKQEVMKEVITKSKLHKYERQKAKEDDDELRERLDADLGDLMHLLQGRKPEPRKPDPVVAPTMNADRLALLQGKSREAADKEYDARLRQMASDQKAAPAERTKTEEEKAKDNVAKLQELEAARQRRMQGEVDSDESGDDKEKMSRKQNKQAPEPEVLEEEEERNDAADFGFAAPKRQQKMPVLDDEDEFELDDELVASESESESGAEDGSDDSDNDDHQLTNGHAHEDEENEFVKGILDDEQLANKPLTQQTGKVAYTYPCPRSHDELVQVIASISTGDLPTVMQRIRALYHPSLSADNKEKLADFAEALVDHLAYQGKHASPLPVLEQIIRHLHSLSRTYPERIGVAFRKHLSQLHESVEPDAGHLVILTAISSIYPTSDHFHQVVTPAIILMARWLGLTSPTTTAHLHKGAFLVSLCLRYQRVSKRYIPEVLRFTQKAISMTPRPSATDLQPHISSLLAMAEQYRHLSAFADIFTPSLLSTLATLPAAKKASQHLAILVTQARQSRRFLTLHNHRPRAIRTSIPKFEDNYAPGRHYDPDRERTDAAKLRNEYRRERKGAVRELRRDANFIAREQLRRTKEADVAYETKFRKLVAQINSEEGAGANEYERVREKRKRAKR